MSNIHRIIRDYFNLSSGQKTRNSFISWFKSEQHVKEKNEALHAIWDELNISSDETTLPSFVKLQKRLFPKTDLESSTQIIPIRRKLLRIASIFLIPLISFGGAFLYVRQMKPTATELAMVECFVPHGEIRTITLPDSSTVHLNSGSLLIYPPSFSGNVRNLYLNGEATFAVKHDEKKPFIVKTADIDVEVLGTVFNLSSYVEDNNVSATLESGKVNIRLKNKEASSFILEPDDQIVLDRGTGKTQIKKVDVSSVMSWKKGFVLVERRSIHDIARMIERKYEVEVHIISDKYNEARINAKFKNNESISECMSVLEQLIPGMKYEIKGRHIYMY